MSFEIHGVFLANVKAKLFRGLRIFCNAQFVWIPFMVLLWFYIFVQCLGLDVGSQKYVFSLVQ